MSRIGKVKFKSGGEITILPPSPYRTRSIDFGWAEITVTFKDGQEMTNADFVYALEAAKNKTMYNKE